MIQKAAIFFLLLLCSFTAFSQGWQVELKSSVEIRTWKLTTKASEDIQPLSGATIKLLKGTTVVKQTTSDGNGDFTIMVPPNEIFTLEVSYAGCNTKRAQINTTNVPDFGEEIFKPSFSIGGFIMSKPFPGIDYSGLNQPLVKVNYVPKIKNFDDDEAATQQGLMIVSKIADAENALIQKFCSTNKEGDDAMKKPDCPLAKTLYEKALALIPGENYPAQQLLKVGECLKEKELAEQKAKEAAAKAEAEKMAKQKAEEEKIAKQKEEAAKAEAEKIAKAQKEKEEKELKAKEEAAKAEAEKMAKQKAEEEKIAKQKEEAAKAEAEKIAKAQKEKEEKELKAKEETAKAEAEKIAKQKAEEERIAKQKEEAAKAEAEKIAKAQKEKAKADAAKAEADKVAKQKAEEDKAKKAKEAAAKAEADKLAKQKAEEEKKAKEAAAKKKEEEIKSTVSTYTTSTKEGNTTVTTTVTATVTTTLTTTGTEIIEEPTKKEPEKKDGGFTVKKTYGSGEQGGDVKQGSQTHKVRTELGSGKYNEAIKKGDEYMNAKQYAEAKAAYQEALKLKPKDEYAKTRLKEAEKLMQ